MQIFKTINIKSSILYKLFFAIAVFASRFGVLPPNFSPLGSFGFFGKSLPLFFATIFIFDFFFGGLYSGFIFTYIGFFGYYLFGLLAKNKLGRQILLLPIASFFFFLTSNLGSFFAMYPHTLTGLIECYTLALPFYGNTMLGDLTFGYSFVAAYHGLKAWKPTWLLNSVSKI